MSFLFTHIVFARVILMCVYVCGKRQVGRALLRGFSSSKII